MVLKIHNGVVEISHCGTIKTADVQKAKKASKLRLVCEDTSYKYEKLITNEHMPNKM